MASIAATLSNLALDDRQIRVVHLTVMVYVVARIVISE
jgi:hypothetical protein